MTIGNFIKGLEILMKYCNNGKDTKYMLQGEHDILYIYPDLDCLPESIDGKKLVELGFFREENCWSVYASA